MQNNTIQLLQMHRYAFLLFLFYHGLFKMNQKMDLKFGNLENEITGIENLDFETQV